MKSHKFLCSSVVIATLAGCSSEDTQEVIDEIVEEVKNNAPTIVLTQQELQVNEGTSTIPFDLNVTDLDGDTLEVSMSGDDANAFNFTSSPLSLSFKQAPDFEAPIDANQDNSYLLTFTVSDGEASVSADLTVSVEDIMVNFTGAIATSVGAEIVENTTNTELIVSAESSDEDSVNYILSGPDSDLFELSDNEIRFIAAPDYEAPNDDDQNNQYQLTLQALNELGEEAFKELTIEVLDQSNLELTVAFPLSESFVDGGANQVSTRGTIVDLEDGEVLAADITDFVIEDQKLDTSTITFNSDSGVANWSSTIEVTLGSNEINYQVSALNGESFEHELTLHKTHFLTDIIAIEYNETNEVVYAADYANNVILKSTDQAGIYEAVSSNELGDGESFTYISDMAADFDAGVMYVSEWKTNTIFSVDLATGNRSIIASNEVGTGEDFLRASYITLDPENSILYVTDAGMGNPGGVGTGKIFSLDLATNIRTVVSDDVSVGTGERTVFPGRTVLDSAGKNLYITDTGYSKVVKLNLETQQRTLVTGESQGTGEVYSALHYIALNDAGTELFVSSASANKLIKVDVATGNRQELWHESNGDLGTYHDIGDLAFDARSNELIVMDNGNNTLFNVTATDGVRTGLTVNSELPATELEDGWGLIYHQPTGNFYSLKEGRTETAFLQFAKDGVSVLDLGERESQPYFLTAGDDTSLYIANDDGADVYKYDIESEQLTLLSSNETSTGTELSYFSAMHYDSEKLFVSAEADSESGTGIYQIDLTNGNRTLVSGHGKGTGDELSYITTIAYQHSDNRLLLIDEDTLAVVAIDLATGDRSLVSGESKGTGDNFDYPIALVKYNDEEILVADNGVNKLYRVNTNTGDRVEFSGNGFEFGSVSGLAVDESKGFAYVLDSDSLAILVIDLDSGDRVAERH